jgi:tetratricopeptide (TPR) repeat protein
MGGVAAAIFISLILFNISFSTKPPETEVLFAQYAEEKAAIELPDNDESRDVYDNIFHAFEQFEASDYKAAIQTFEELDSLRSAYPEISLFRGLIHMEIGESQVALSLFEDCAKHRSPYRKYARWLKNVAYIRLLDPDAAFIFFIERSDGFDNLPRHWKRMIRSVNLIGTARIKEFRQFANPGAEGPWIIHRDDFIGLCVHGFLFLLALIVWIDLALLRLYWKYWVPLAAVQFFIPLGGPIVYFVKLRSFSIKRTNERLKEREHRTRN